MNLRVLALEPDEETADQLLEALRENEVDSVSMVASMSEACSALRQQRYDVAIIPLQNAHRQVHTYRALQSELPVILTAIAEEVQISEDYEELFQGVLHIPNLEDELSEVLAAFVRGEPEEPVPNGFNGDQGPTVSREMLQYACQEVDLGDEVQLAVFSRGGEVVAWGGRMDEARASLVVKRVSETWDERPRSAQIQFLQMPDFVDPVLLYIRPAAEYLLTLIALPYTSVTEVRSRADHLVAQLTGGASSEESADAVTLRLRTDVGTIAPEKYTRSFAIAWRPVERLPTALQSVVSDGITNLAKRNGCVLTHLSVEAYLIQVVVTCPPGKSSVWAVKLFKDGVQELVRSLYGVSATLWRKGYYAKESRQPLPEDELKLLPERT